MTGYSECSGRWVMTPRIGSLHRVLRFYESMSTASPLPGGRCGKMIRKGRVLPSRKSPQVSATTNEVAIRELDKSAPGLVRELTASQATALVVGTVIGSAIFLVPAEMMQEARSPWIVYSAWVAGAMLSICGAVTYAELSAMRPHPAGDYVYVRDAYGPLVGFLVAWTDFALSSPGAIATVATGFVRVLGGFSSMPWPDDSVPFLRITTGQLLACIAIFFFAALNYVGVRKAAQFQVVFTGLKILMILLIVVAGFFFAHGGLANLVTIFTPGRGGIAGFYLALVAALWAFDGWADLADLAGEVRDPGKNLPRSLIGGVAIVAALYMLLNAAVQFAFSARQIATSQHVGAEVMQVAFGHVGMTLASVGMAISILGTMNGTVMSAARMPYAVARDGYFFKFLGRAHPRYHTPGAVLMLQAVMGVLLVLFGGSFQKLFELTIFAIFLVSSLSATTLFVFRIREPNAARPYKVWGYPFTTGFFILASASLLYVSFVENIHDSLLGCALIVAGVPVYLVFRRLKARDL